MLAVRGKKKRVLSEVKKRHQCLTALETAAWPAPGSEDTELGVLMELEVRHGEAEVHA
jgi:hypothetical protein